MNNEKQEAGPIDLTLELGEVGIILSDNQTEHPGSFAIKLINNQSKTDPWLINAALTVAHILSTKPGIMADMWAEVVDNHSQDKAIEQEQEPEWAQETQGNA